MIQIYIPTYEPSPLHLHAAVQSVLAQTETRWKMLIHDDCSQADVRTMLQPYLGDMRIKFQQSPTRLGIGGNWNACLKQGESAYVQYLFQDDQWEPTYLADMLEVMEQHPSVGFASAEHVYACETGIETAEMYQLVRDFRKTRIANGIHGHEEFLQFWIKHQLHPNVIGEPSFVMLRRSLTQEVGFFHEDMPQFLDVEYWLRCLVKSDWFYRNEDLGTFRVHRKGASAQNQESGAGIYDRLECFETLIAALPQGTLKKEAVEARNRALVIMAQKFFKRRQEGKKTPIKGGGKFKTFALQHPLLIARALFGAWQHGTGESL
jgi:GT2 family glycosyltransferase